MKISVLIATVLVLCAPAAFAQPIFQCTTPNGKQIQLLDNGKTLEYSFGKVGKPEIVVRVLRSQARYYDWRGVGRSIAYSVDIPNGDVVYNIHHAYDRIEQKIAAGVAVQMPSNQWVEVNCHPKAIRVNQLDNVKNIPSGYDD